MPLSDDVIRDTMIVDLWLLWTADFAECGGVHLAWIWEHFHRRNQITAAVAEIADRTALEILRAKHNIPGSLWGYNLCVRVRHVTREEHLNFWRRRCVYKSWSPVTIIKHDCGIF